MGEAERRQEFSHLLLAACDVQISTWWSYLSVYRLRRRSRINLLLSKSFILASASSSRREGETREEAIELRGKPLIRLLACKYVS